MKRLLIGMLLLCSSQTALAGPGRDALERFSEGLQTLEARFEQAVLDTENNRQGLLHGVFLLKRPDRFRWDYVSPESRHIIADGRDLWVVEDDLNHVTRFYQKLALKGSPAKLLLGTGSLDKEFNIVELGERQGLQWLELSPKDPDSDILRVLIAFKGDRLLKLELTDQFGQISRFSFFDIKRNPALDDDLFAYQPPDDWDVLNQQN
ncbi:MAG: outer membrane lipoprotein carrier protein LolA [Gammaproteobacteria bacterium]|nr:MAG: outer membrane lipoprotein carrier protein LolA [Gammaproteobacteria bacterium]